jgi:hypothetical protein
MLGNPEQEQAKMRALVQGGGSMPNEKPMGEGLGTPPTEGPPAGSPPPSVAAEEEERPSQFESPAPSTGDEARPGPSPASPEKQEEETDPALLELFQDDEVLLEDEEGVVEVNGKEIPLSKIAQWKQAAESGQQREMEIAQKEQQLAGVAQLFMQDPMAAAEATGVKDKLIAQLREEAGTSAPESEPSLDDLGSGDELGGDEAMRRYAKSLERKLQAQSSQIQELRQAVDGQGRDTAAREYKRERDRRLGEAQGHLVSMVDSVPTLKGPLGQAMKKSLRAELESGIDSAPMDPAGLKEWVKDQLKEEIRDVGLLEAGKRKAAVRGGKRSPVPARAGETPATPTGADAPWEEGDVSDNDQRKKAALAWFAHHSAG